MALPNRLKFGIFMAPVHHLGENPTLALERDMELIEWLDRLGFDEAWTGEHYSAGWRRGTSTWTPRRCFSGGNAGRRVRN